MSKLVSHRHFQSFSQRRSSTRSHIGRRTLAVAGLALVAALASSSASAGPYTSEYVFGDSLSDNGNLAELYHQNFPNPPSYHDSFTNGPVAAAVSRPSSACR